MASVREEAWVQAARAFGLDPEPRVRPGPLLWLKYVFWGPLPARYRWWVLWDTTTTTWIVRHFLRLLVAVAVPAAAIAIFLPANGALRAMTAGVTAGCAIVLAGVWVNEGSDHRLVQAGWPAAIGPELRAQRAIMQQRIGNARRRGG